MSLQTLSKRKNGKKLSMTPGEELYLSRIEQKTAIPALVLKEIALKERVPVTSLKILGGNPFIDVSGLDRKIQNKAQDENISVKEISAELIQSAEQDNGYTARAQGTVKYLDKTGFKEAIAKLDASGMCKEMLEKLEQIYTETYKDEGWANPEDCAAIAWTYKKAGDKRKQRDKLLTTNINMMACRRASSRAKRQATGCGLTSLDEAPMVDSQSADTVEEQRKATKEQLEKIENLKADRRITKTEIKLIENELSKDPSELRVEQIITRIGELLVGRIPAKEKVKKQTNGGQQYEKARKEKVLV